MKIKGVIEDLKFLKSLKKEKRKEKKEEEKKERMILKIVKIYLGLSLMLLLAVWGPFIFR